MQESREHERPDEQALPDTNRSVGRWRRDGRKRDVSHLPNLYDYLGFQGMNDQWCILRMAGPRTLALAHSLGRAGFTVWTPVKTIMRPIPGQRRNLLLGTRRAMREVNVPILPGFAFVDASQVAEVSSVAVDPLSPHHGFSVLQVAGRAPIIGSSSLSGLRDAEARAAEITEETRTAQSRHEARKLRAERMRTERARRKALRSERRDFAVGDAVMLTNMPAMQGMVGSIVKSNGRSAKVCFGGAIEFEVEAWQIVPNTLWESAA